MNIDELTIEIQGKAGKSSKQIDELVGKLQKLETMCYRASTGLRALSKSFDAVSKNSEVLKKMKFPKGMEPKINKSTSETATQEPIIETPVVTTPKIETPKVDTYDGNALKEQQNDVNKLQMLFGKLQAEVDKYKNRLRDVNSIKLGKIDIPFSNTLGQTFDNLKSKAIETGESIKNIFSNAVNGISNAFTREGSIWNTLLNNTKNAVGFLGEKLKEIPKILSRVASSGVSAFSKLFSVISSNIPLINSTKSRIDGMFGNSSLSSIKRFTMGLLGVRSAFSGLRKAVSSYLAYDTKLNSQLQNDWAVLGSLLAPILEYVIGLFTKLVSYIGAVVKMLTGVDLVARANSKSIGAMGSSAKKTANELGNLAKFDDLNVVDFGKDSGGGSGGGGAGGLEPLTMGEIDTSFLDRFIQKIKDGDWYGLGMEIGMALNEGLRSIDWEWLDNQAIKWATNFADLFNGLTDGIDWALLGESIANGLNVAMDFVNTFYDKYNFENLGKSLAIGVNNMISTLDWEGVGQYFANRLQSMIEVGEGFLSRFSFTNLGENLAVGIMSFIDSVDWQQGINNITDGFIGMVKGVQAFVKTIKWGDLGKGLSDGLIGALNHLTEKIQEVNWQELGNDLWTALKDFVTNIDWSGVADALFTALGTAIGASIQLLWGFLEDAITSVANYLKGFIQEGDDWRDAGKHIIAGVFEGIVNAVKNVGTWIKEHIFNPFINGFKNIFGIHSPSTVMIEQGKYIIEGLFQGVKGIWEKVKSVFTGLRDRISEIFSDIVNKIKSIFSVEKMRSHFDSVVSKIKSIFNTVTEPIKNAFKKAYDGVISIFQHIGNWFTTHVTDPIKNAFSGLWDGVKGILNKMISGLNKMIDGVNKIKFDVPDWVPGIGGKKWGFNIKNIPKLQTGTNQVPREGLYHLHKDEAVVPKKYNPAINNKAYDNNNKETMAKLDKLINVVEQLNFTNVVNVGDEKLYSKTVKYVNRINNIYGEDVLSF